MKILFLLLLSTFTAFAGNEVISWVGPPKLVAENGSVKVFAAVRPPDPRAHVLREYRQVRAALPDGRNIPLASASSHPGPPDPQAIVTTEGNIALALGGLEIFFAPDYRPNKVLKLRTDRFASFLPEIKYFTITQVTWQDDMIACAGTFEIKGKTGDPSEACGPFPFISRLLVTADPGLKDHQLLWTTWRPGTSTGNHPDVASHQSAQPIPDSLHFQGKVLLWRNMGNWRKSPFPPDGPAHLTACSWQVISLETGKTGALASHAVDREKLAALDTELAKQFDKEGPVPRIFTKRDAFVLEALHQFKP